MIADIAEGRRVTLDLPPEVPVGRAEIVIRIEPQTAEVTRRPRTSLADWAEAHAEPWGDALDSTDVEGFTGRGA